MLYKSLKFTFILLLLCFLVWGFSNSYASHNIGNIVHVVALGIDKSDNNDKKLKVSFQFANFSSSSEGPSGGESSTVITSINADSINSAISLMNSYIGKELNLSHCKVIVFSKDFATEGIAHEIYTFMNDEDVRPSTNIVISTSKANTYLKNANPNIEKQVTKYYDTFELTSNFTGLSDDATIGKFYNKLVSSTTQNTAILGRTFSSSGESSSSGQESEQSSQDSSGSQSNSNSASSSDQALQASSSGQSGNSFQSSSGSKSTNSSQSSSSTQSESSSQNPSDTQSNSSSKDSSDSEDSNSGLSGSTSSGDSSLDISGKRGTQNVGIAVFLDDKFIGQLSDIESICHMLVTNNIDSCTISVPIEDYPDNKLDLFLSPARKAKISVDTSSDKPKISISIYCTAKILNIDGDAEYTDPKILENLSHKTREFLKENISSYLNKTSKEFKSDIAGFGKYALSNFLTIPEWNKYEWLKKYENSEFSVKVYVDVTSKLFFTKR